MLVFDRLRKKTYSMKIDKNSYSLFGTEVATGTTSMTEVGEHQHVLGENGNGMVGADLSALATVGTLVLIYSGHQHIYRLPAGNRRLKQNMVVRLLDVTVEKHNFMAIFQGKGETGGYQRLPRSSFTTGNRYYHRLRLSTLQFSHAL